MRGQVGDPVARARGLVDGREEFRRVGDLGAGQAQTGQSLGFEVREHLVEGLLCRRHGEMPEDTGDQEGRDLEVLFRPSARRFQAGQNGGVAHVATDVGLWVEEDFCVYHTVTLRPSEVRIGQFFEVGAGDQNGHADEVVVEEVFQRREVRIA